MTIKRIILIFLTIGAILRILLSLGDSLSEPQIQGRLELYQTNLVLHASEFDPSYLDSNIDLTNFREVLISNDPYLAAPKEYKKTLEATKNTRDTLQGKLNKITQNSLNQSKETQLIPTAEASDLTTQKQLENAIENADKLINELNLKIGILQAARGDEQTALKTWENVTDSSKEIIITLKNIWINSSLPSPNTETIINDNLDGWFRYKSLVKLYELQGKNTSDLKTQEQTIAFQAITKLLIISAIPLLGGITGISLLLFLLVQLLLKKEKSLLATNNSLAWETPWNGEIVWQVLIVGFFFIGQFLLPLLFGIFRFDPSGLSLRYKAFYVLISYLLMTAGGIIVLYLSIKEFFPLPQNWFKFNLSIKNFLWGFGGYLIALPLVVLISLINQQFWQGQGGSNPILFLALQAQDKVALTIFFLTASVAAPIFEELIFRGFLLPSLTRYLPVWSSILISSFIFAVAHLSISEVLPLTTLGIVLGFVYTRSRNLFSPMLLHSFWNSGTLLSLFVLGS